MSRRRCTVAIAAVTVVVAGGLALGQSVASAGTARTLRLTEVVASTSFDDLGAKGTSIGDRLAFKTALKDGTGKQVGFGAADCLRVSGTSDANGLAQCLETFHVRGGDVVASGIYNFAAKSNHWAIVGGTGRYRGASGQVDFTTQNATTFADTFRFDN